MKTGFDFNQGVLKILYYRYKMVLVPSVIVLLSVLVFFIFIFPQFQGLSDLQATKDNLVSQVALLKNNENTLASINDADITDRLSTTTKALPPEKDFIGILSTISKASLDSGVLLNDFSFSVGDLATPSAQASSQLSLSITLNVQGSLLNVDNFINDLSNAFPLSQVTSVQSTNYTSTIVASFYYKPFPPLATGDNSTVQTLTPSEIKAIDSLSQMK